MKKLLIYSIFGYLLFFCTNCMQCDTEKNNCITTEIVYKYTLDDYVTKNFKVYETKDDIITLLDSIIEKVNMCEESINKQIVYSFAVDSTLYSSKSIFISVNDYKYADILCYDADALFFYKGYLFMYYGVFLDMYFKDINKTIERNCIKPIIPEGGYIIDDTLLPIFHWQYIYENNKLKIINIFSCDK